MSEEVKKYQCTTCKQEFEYPDWQCSKKPGNHTVEQTIYYHQGGRDIADIRDRVKFGPLVILSPGYEYASPTDPGKRLTTRKLEVKFEGAKYATCDPEEQYFLDRKGFLTGETGLIEWRRIYWTPERQRQQAEVDIREANEKLQSLNRELREKNTLLDAVQRQKQAQGA